MNLTSDVHRVLLNSIPKIRVYAKKRAYKHAEVSIHRKSTSTQSKSNSTTDYCVDLVRKYDYENYLGTLLLPKDSQRAAFALRAFNVELALVHDTVSDKKIGLMRLQFWKQAVESIYQSTPPHTPVATELAGACKYYRLSKRWLERIVEARAHHGPSWIRSQYYRGAHVYKTAQMQLDSYTSVKSVEDYAEQVNSSLYYLQLECLGIKNVNADHAASHLGKAQGIVTVLRATPHHASKRHVYLPMDVLSKSKVSQEDIVRGKISQPLKDCVFDIASTAHQHLEKARSLQTALPPKAYLVFLNARICDHYLKNLQKVDFNIFDGMLQRKNYLLAYQMYINRWRRRF